MLPLEVNRDPRFPPHEQVAAEIRRAIAEGEAAEGERLPPAVDLAAVLGVNKNTVIRALHILRDEGLLDFARGRGVRVVGTPQQSVVVTRINEFFGLRPATGLPPRGSCGDHPNSRLEMIQVDGKRCLSRRTSDTVQTLEGSSRQCKVAVLLYRVSDTS